MILAQIFVMQLAIKWRFKFTPHPTSASAICTTWGNHNKWNMDWNEQQTSTNWRLDRIKIWSRLNKKQ